MCNPPRLISFMSPPTPFFFLSRFVSPSVSVIIVELSKFNLFVAFRNHRPPFEDGNLRRRVGDDDLPGSTQLSEEIALAGGWR